MGQYWVSTGTILAKLFKRYWLTTGIQYWFHTGLPVLIPRYWHQYWLLTGSHYYPGTWCQTNISTVIGVIISDVYQYWAMPNN